VPAPVPQRTRKQVLQRSRPFASSCPVAGTTGPSNRSLLVHLCGLAPELLLHSFDVTAALVSDPALTALVVFAGAAAGTAFIVVMIGLISNLRKDEP